MQGWECRQVPEQVCNTVSERVGSTDGVKECQTVREYITETVRECSEEKVRECNLVNNPDFKCYPLCWSVLYEVQWCAQRKVLGLEKYGIRQIYKLARCTNIHLERYVQLDRYTVRQIDRYIDSLTYIQTDYLTFRKISI